MYIPSGWPLAFLNIKGGSLSHVIDRWDLSDSRSATLESQRLRRYFDDGEVLKLPGGDQKHKNVFGNMESQQKVLKSMSTRWAPKSPVLNRMISEL